MVGSVESVDCMFTTMAAFLATIQDTSISTTEVMCTDLSIDILQDRQLDFVMYMQDRTEDITDLLDIRITLLTGITQDVRMPDWVRFIETTIPIEGKISIEMTEELLLGTTALEELITEEAMLRFPIILLGEEIAM